MARHGATSREASLNQIPMRSLELSAARGPRLVAPLMTALATTARLPLFTFNTPEDLARWERIDDVIMGGVSSSKLVVDPEGGSVRFEGTLREEGGGFCGQRTKLLSEPLDLSGNEGIYVDIGALDGDAPLDRRVLKFSLRTTQDAGQTLYQCALRTPIGSRERVFLPFSDFSLVSGSRTIDGAPPLNASTVYQVSVVVSRFPVKTVDGADPLAVTELDGFQNGRFRLRVYEIGAYAPDLPPAPTTYAIPQPIEDADMAAKQPPIARMIRSLLKATVFSEERRRRRAATIALRKRGTGPFGLVRRGWSGRRAGGRAPVVRALGATARIGAQDVAVLVLRALGKVLFGALKAVRKLSAGAKAARARPGAAPA